MKPWPQPVPIKGLRPVARTTYRMPGAQREGCGALYRRLLAAGVPQAARKSAWLYSVCVDTVYRYATNA